MFAPGGYATGMEECPLSAPWRRSRTTARAKATSVRFVQRGWRDQKRGPACLAFPLNCSRARAVRPSDKRFSWLDDSRPGCVAWSAGWHNIPNRVVERIAVDVVGDKIVGASTSFPDAPRGQLAAPMTWVSSRANAFEQHGAGRAHIAVDPGERVLRQVAHSPGAWRIERRVRVGATLRTEGPYLAGRSRVEGAALFARFVHGLIV